MLTNDIVSFEKLSPDRLKNSPAPYVSNEGPDQPALSRSVVRVFTVTLHNQWLL